jgi:hemerythrin-like domain-containing protein
MDAITLLSRDHEEVLAMFEELESGANMAAMASGADRTLRKELVTRLVIEQSRHEAVEEQYFWPAVRRVAPDGDRLADKALEQESKAKQVLDKLDKTDPHDPLFENLLTQFITDARKHIDYEQDKVWPALVAAIDRDELDELGEKMERAKKMAPTRPHPHTPANAAVLKTVGPAVAAVDKIRDAATGRGRG